MTPPPLFQIVFKTVFNLKLLFGIVIKIVGFFSLDILSLLASSKYFSPGICVFYFSFKYYVKKTIFFFKLDTVYTNISLNIFSILSYWCVKCWFQRLRGIHVQSSVYSVCFFEDAHLVCKIFVLFLNKTNLYIILIKLIKRLI